MLKPFCYSILVFYFFKFHVLFGSEISNFILISNFPHKKDHTDYRIPEDDANKFTEISNLIKNINPNFSSLFLYFKDEGFKHEISSNMLLINNSKIYLYSENKKINLLGIMIDPMDKILNQLNASVLNGKLIASYWKNKTTPVSIIVDDKGLVYSASMDTAKNISIETLGLASLTRSH